VTGLWLMPIFPSPSYHGYDVTDYYNVNPQYGTMDDFKTLLAEAHERGIRVTIDFVLNHTSDQHPWFKADAAGDPQYQDFSSRYLVTAPSVAFNRIERFLGVVVKKNKKILDE